MKQAFHWASVCSGIGAPEMALKLLGDKNAKCLFAAENAPFPRAVFSQRFPEIPLYEDFREIDPNEWKGKLMESSQAPLANPSPLPGNEKGLKTLGEISPWKLSDLHNECTSRGLLLKTYTECSAKGSEVSSTQSPGCLKDTTEITNDLFEGARDAARRGIPVPGEYWMEEISPSPKRVDEFLLSAQLQTVETRQRSYATPKGASGIWRRRKKFRRALPYRLRRGLLVASRKRSFSPWMLERYCGGGAPARPKQSERTSSSITMV